MGAPGNKLKVNKTLGRHLEDRLTPEQRQRLRAFAILKGRLIGDVAAEAIEQYLKARGF
jgi:predicted DNA-binding protein